MEFEIYEDGQEWMWVLIDSDTSEVITSGRAPRRDDCFKQIEDFKRDVAKAKVPNRH